MTERDFKPIIILGWPAYVRFGGHKISGLGDKGPTKFCTTRIPENCKLCLANGQAKKVGCKDPIQSES